jgi:hypothetical protein
MGIFFVQDVFSGATVSSGNLTIPSGSIVSYVPTTSGNPPATEMVFGLLETMHRAVTSGNPVNITTTVSNSFGNNVLSRFYTFQVNLDFNPEVSLENLNVVVEPTTTTTTTTTTAEPTTTTTTTAAP